MSNPQALDIVIPYHPKDVETIIKCVDSCRMFVKDVRNIYILSRDNPHVDGTTWIPEESFHFKMADIRAAGIREDRVGWYFQQLMKIHADMVIDGLSENFLIVDSDVVFKNQVDFFNANGKPYYAFGREYYEPYFKHMARLFPGLTKQFADKSGICHHMVFNLHVLAEIRGKIGGDAVAWKAILGAVDTTEMSGFSEYELYFNYMIKYHPSEMEIRPLAWTDARYESDNDNNYHYVAYHAWMRIRR